MSDEPAARTVEKLVAVVLVVAWTAGTLAMTFPGVETTVPPHWLPFTALVFLIVGRLWNIEVAELLPVGGGGGSTTNDESDD